MDERIERTNRPAARLGRVAFVVFDRMTTLDFLGVFDPVTRLRTMGFWPELTWDICALQPVVTDIAGLRVLADRVGEPLSSYDLLVVPGGYGTRALEQDQAFLAWLRTAEPVPYKAAVCTGSVLLGAAGFLRDRAATTHPSAYQELAPYCASVIDQRIVDTGEVVTAGGVTSSIDLGLYLVGKLAGPEIRQRIRQQMDYPYEWASSG